MGRDTLIDYMAASLEEWDMKDPPNSFTGWPYEMIAEDILNKMLTNPVMFAILRDKVGWSSPMKEKTE